jgi:hypothetical protein
LFLVAVSQRFRILGVRIAAIAMAVGLLAYPASSWLTADLMLCG